MSTLCQDADVIGGAIKVIADSSEQVSSSMQNARTRLDGLINAVAAVDVVATDNSDTELALSLTKVAAQFVSDFTSVFGGIDALAQFVSDLSEVAGLEGTNSELRVYRNGSVVSVTQDD